MKHSTVCKLLSMICFTGLAHIALAQDATSTLPHKAVMTAEIQSQMTPQDVLNRLKKGNQRFVNGKMKNRALLTQAGSTALKQHPVAVVLNCMDSRTSPEIIFDQGIGDIFAIRIAGNIQNDNILGSMEYALQIAGAKLVAIIGHTNCGAIRGACEHAKLGYLTGLLHKIQPAINRAEQEEKSAVCSNQALINQIAKDNVLLVMKQVSERSQVISQLIKEGKIIVVGGIQNVATGEVEFFI